VTEDRHDERLRSHVRPQDWPNPTPRDRYHLVVIGGGTAGLVSAAGAAGLGARVALVERHLLGGDCLNVGCVPSKAMIASARSWKTARTSKSEHHGPAAEGEGDFAAVMSRMRALRADLAPIDGAPRFRELGVDVYFGEAAFTGADAVEVAGARLRFRRAVIATGARAAVPDIPGIADVPFLTNETVFSLTELPRHLVVIGGGPIGCELAQCFARFGSKVTLVERASRLLARDDGDAAAIVHRALADDGVRILTGTAVRRVSRRGPEIQLETDHDEGGELVASELLIASGRSPNIERLGLDLAGVSYTPQGVTVDDRLRTSNPRIYAAGDVCSRLQFTHAADAQARAVIQNALFFGRVRQSRLVVPWVTYTSPEVAQVGHTAESAREAGVAIDTIDVPLHDVDRARLDGLTTGFARVHLRRGASTIVGATVVAEHAGDLITEVTLAMTNGIGLGGIGKTIHPYPTQGDVLRKAADAWRRTRLTPFVRSLFERWFRLFS
jgi:pyruvate/2-oxoglutarate dehydrogenase complex dihydrolipoamide dehydrogenase (E3) component